MNVFTDNRAVTLASSVSFGLVDIVHTGVEKKRKIAKFKVKFTLEQAMTTQWGE
jgi:hypothetical protein